MGRNVREIPLTMESLHLWRGMNERINGDTGFRQPGVMYLCETDAEVARQEAWLDQARQYQVDAHLLRGGELDGVIPVPAPLSSPACTHRPTAARNPRRRHPPSSRPHARTGPIILTSCAVRGIYLQAGRIAGVVTEKGRIICDSVVLAGGAWSRLFCGNAGIDLPQLNILASVLRTKPLDRAPEISAAGSVFAFRKRLDGGYSNRPS